jgi:hypothetical protein
MFFERLVQMKGSTWLEYTSPEELIKFSNLFFRDLAFGSIDKNLYGYVFSDYQFMDIMTNQAYRKKCSYDIEKYAMDTLAQKDPMINNEQMFQMTYSHIMKCDIAYNAIWMGLSAISRDRHLGWLDVITSQIKQYRYEL